MLRRVVYYHRMLSNHSRNAPKYQTPFRDYTHVWLCHGEHFVRFYFFGFILSIVVISFQMKYHNLKQLFFSRRSPQNMKLPNERSNEWILYEKFFDVVSHFQHLKIQLWTIQLFTPPEHLWPEFPECSLREEGISNSIQIQIVDRDFDQNL